MISTCHMRRQFLSYLPWFVSEVTRIRGVRRVRPTPLDYDSQTGSQRHRLLIEVEDGADLAPFGSPLRFYGFLRSVKSPFRSLASMTHPSAKVSFQPGPCRGRV